MRLAFLGFSLVLLVAPLDALASPACSGPWIRTYTAPVGCDLTIIARPGGDAPSVVVQRNGAPVAGASANIMASNIQLEVDYYDTTCGTGDVAYVESESFVHYQITLSGALAGDEVVVEPFGTVTIQETGPCAAVPLPTPMCYADPARTPCDDDDDDDSGGGCSAGESSAALPLALGLLALAFQARRRRPVAQ